MKAGKRAEQAAGLIWILAAGVVCWVAVMTLRAAIPKPFSLDEADIAIRAHMLWHHGPPGPVMAMGSYEGIPHPPLCEHFFSWIFRFFGEHEESARSAGAVIYVLIGLMMAALVRELSVGREGSRRTAAMWATLVLYAANPLLLQHSLLVDADTTCVAFSVALFGWLFIRFERIEGPDFVRSRVWLMLAFALICFSKEIAPTLTAVSVVVYRLLNRQGRRLLLDLGITIGLGTALAGSLWWLYCALTGTDVMSFFRKASGSKLRVSNPEFWRRVIGHLGSILRWPLYWVSAPFFAACFFVWIGRIGVWWKLRRLEPSDYCLVLALAVWVPYLLIKPSVDMMKYQHPIYPFFIVWIALGLADSLHALQEAGKLPVWKNPLFPVLACFSAGVLFVYYRPLGDYLLFLFDPAQNARWKQFIADYYRPMGAAAVFLVLVLWLRRRWFICAGISVCLLFTIPIQLALNVNQAEAEYTTAESWTNYGEHGLADAAMYLVATVPDGRTVSMRKDLLYRIVYRAGKKNVQNVDFYHLMRGIRGPIALDDYLSKTRIDPIVVDRVTLLYAPLSAAARPVLDRYYRIDRKFGDFLIFKRRD